MRWYALWPREPLTSSLSYWHAWHRTTSDTINSKQSYSVSTKNISFHRLRKEYEVIADKALTTPKDTEHLITLKEEIATVVEKTLPQLDTRIIEARHRYIYTPATLDQSHI